MSVDPRLVETFTSPTNSKYEVLSICGQDSNGPFLFSCRHQILGKGQCQTEYSYELICEFDP